MAMFLIWSLALLFLSIPITIHAFRSQTNNHKTLPPGSFGWPIMGETLAFVFNKPRDFISKRMTKYSPIIFKTHILGEKTVVLCGPEGHKFIFSNEDKLFKEFRPHATQRLFRSYNTKASTPTPKPMEVKQVIRQPGFLKVDVLVRCLGGMDAMIHQQLQIHWGGKYEVEVYPLTKTITLLYASKLLLGIDNPERIARLVKHFDNVTLGLHSIISSIPGTTFYRANKAADAIRKELLCVIKEKKEEMAKGNMMHDLVSHLIMSTDTSGKFMPSAAITDVVMGLLAAGYSTVASAMVFLIKFIGESPEVYDKIKAGTRSQ